MNHRNLINDAWVYSSNVRAEDGLQSLGGWRALRDTVLVPLGLYVALFLLLLVASHTAFAQTGSGRIAGLVKDASGAVIPGSKVSLVNMATGVSQDTTSDGAGVFNFLVVSIGQYQLAVTADGFTPYKEAGKIRIDVNTSLTIDVTLQLKQGSQTVTVMAGSAEVHTADTQLGQTIESKEIVDIPLNGRSYTDLLAVQAGVSPVTTSGAGNSSSGGGLRHGSRGRRN